ncbi:MULTISPECIES: RNA polymerase-binding protein DksA [unclassified Salinicola]|uniref:RNA polymerase-binding protein DksA n=1 Tax=unclassified Salinicola TaxID=2634022 RepID=UPI0004E7AFD6|nr:MULTISPECIES: RNA polymerase-binding protein DksA [unclassified Salinicola]KFF48416.1 molecular chaperone DnaK [Gammaproteobacteria bacterium MFB021]MCE3028729.1 RNA polymerase-binding protein DksA [Salinicola sp. DM10]WIX32357.1 RNA polymerase-binding protein DksA [Salinicola sp. JS01]
MALLPIEDEAQLLAMPAADYMNEAQLAFFQRRLERERETLATALAETRAIIVDSRGDGDDADLAANEETLSLLLRQADRETRLLRKIAAALKRIESGDYGFCDETGQPIGLKRLLLRPTATLCLEAKERQEQREHHYAKRRSA